MRRMSSRRVFLHVGTPKSGVTGLQRRLAANRKLLADQGVLYPDQPHDNHFHPAVDLTGREWAGEADRARGRWDQLAADANRAGGDVLISHEVLAAATPDQVGRAFRSFPDADVHVVLTARDLGRQLPAEWQESVTHRARSSFGKYAKRVARAPRTRPDLWFWRVHSVPDVLTRWGTGLPPDRVHVVTVPQPGGPAGALWERFASVLGLDPSLPYTAADEDEPALGVAEMLVLRRLNARLRELDVPRETYGALVRALLVRETFAQRPAVEPVVVPPPLREFVEEVTTEWLEWLRGSGVDIVGDLADLQPVWPDPDASPHPDSPRARDVTDAAIEALAAVVANVERDGDASLVRVARRLLRP